MAAPPKKTNFQYNFDASCQADVKAMQAGIDVRINAVRPVFGMGYSTQPEALIKVFHPDYLDRFSTYAASFYFQTALTPDDYSVYWALACGLSDVDVHSPLALGWTIGGLDRAGYLFHGRTDPFDTFAVYGMATCQPAPATFMEPIYVTIRLVFDMVGTGPVGVRAGTAIG